MRRFIKGADGKLRGSRPVPQKAPSPQSKGASLPSTRDCQADDSDSLNSLAAAWDGNKKTAQSPVIPQRSVVSTPNIKSAREILGVEHTHVQARITVAAEPRTIQDRLLRAGYTCAVPAFPHFRSKDARPEQEEEHPNTKALLAKIEARGLWRLTPHPENPHSTIVTTPNVPNSEDGWKYLEDGLRHMKGPRFLRPQAALLFTGSTPPAPPPEPPAGYSPISGVKRLIYSV